MNATTTRTVGTCRRCDDLAVAGSFCVSCTRLGDESAMAVRCGLRTFWRFAKPNDDEPTPFEIEVLDDDRLFTSFATKPYRIAWLRHAAFSTRNGALRYRIERLERNERRAQERMTEATRIADEQVRDAEALLDEYVREAREVVETFAREQRDRSVRRPRLVREIRAAPVTRL